ncbi:hypothetical protein B0H16DRAFT_1469517 [Mycena metata]|uniref:Uncharacterized protein n=1 Tax=Mycena metata TaxID=1033252 RepID=A0AAD7HZH4_9AGAR|nr:hypothetical protein B0H16DRAFT_1469517 [Mycena metata]
MPRTGTAARRCQRAGLPPSNQAKEDGFFGSTIAFFQGFKAEFLVATEVNGAGAFYHSIGQKYLDKYGYALEWNKDLDDGQEVVDDVNLDEDVASLLPEEADFCAKNFAQLHQKKKKQMPFTKLFNKPDLNPPAPVKPRALHFYSRHYYVEHIKPCIDAWLAAMSCLGAANTPKVTWEAWLVETPEFCQEMLLSLEKQSDIAAQAYKTNGELSVLNNAGYYLQPFADAIHKCFGMNVALLLCGPIPECGGRIEVRRNVKRPSAQDLERF